jgi:pentatricopeptide repeat protein
LYWRGEAVRGRGWLCALGQVTFNTLVDLYGKLGQWERAVQVLDAMRHEVRWAV